MVKNVKTGWPVNRHNLIAEFFMHMKATEIPSLCSDFLMSLPQPMVIHGLVEISVGHACHQ
jgi:hypothetical protein